MEDQPADPGDLTAAGANGPADRRRWWQLRRPEKTEQVVREDTATSDSGDYGETPSRVPVGKAERAPKKQTGAEDEEAELPEPETAAETERTDEPEPVLVPHRPVGKRLVIVGAAAGVLFVAAGAFAGAAIQPYLADRALVATKLDIARTAADAITTLWTYTPDDMESLPDRSEQYLGGDFAAEYRRYIDAIVSTNKQAQVSNDTQVMGTAVESLNGSEATALVYTNSVSTSPVSNNIPSLRYLSYRLTMERRDANWLITRMTAITKLDLTPQL